MNPSEIMLQLAEDLAVDQELQEWCTANLGKELTIILGLDEDNPPGEEMFPICAVVDLVENRGEDSKYTKYTARLAMGIFDESIEKKGNLIVYPGMAKVVDLKHQIQSACFRFNVGGTSVKDDWVPGSSHPLFLCYTAVEFTVAKSNRRAMR